jgi:hypothetical protein
MGKQLLIETEKRKLSIGPEKVLGSPSLIFNNVYLIDNEYGRGHLPFIVCEWALGPKKSICNNVPDIN